MRGTVSPLLNDANVTNAFTSAPTNLGTNYVWIPPASNLHAAGAGGADIGAEVLYRYQNGVKTKTTLWDAVSGAFSCGAIVAGVNDVAGASCSNVHVRLNVSASTLPAGYGGSTLSVPANFRLVGVKP